MFVFFAETVSGDKHKYVHYYTRTSVGGGDGNGGSYTRAGSRTRRINKGIIRKGTKGFYRMAVASSENVGGSVDVEDE